MKKAFISFLQVFQQIRSDLMLLAACFTPILVGILIKFGVPLLEKGIQFSLSEYYMIFDLFLSIMAPVLLCFAFAMITLEEMDDKVARYFSITPLGKVGYLLSRLGIPAILAVIITFVVLFFFSLSGQSLFMVVALAFMGAIQAIVVALMIITLSTNKLEGMAVTKLASLTLLGIPVPFFISGNIQFAVGFLPSFWVAKMIQTGAYWFLCPALLVAALWYGFLGKRLVDKLAG